MNLRSLPFFEEQALRHLQEDTDPEASLKILARFFVTLSESLEQMKNGLGSKNLEIFWRAAHKVSGTAALLGFGDFGRQSKNLSHLLKEASSFEPHLEESSDYIENCSLLKKGITSAFPSLQSYL